MEEEWEVCILKNKQTKSSALGDNSLNNTEMDQDAFSQKDKTMDDKTSTTSNPNPTPNLNDVVAILKECQTLLHETRQIQQEVVKVVNNFKLSHQGIPSLNEKKSNYIYDVRDSNRAWRLYGNYHKPIIPILDNYLKKDTETQTDIN